MAGEHTAIGIAIRGQVFRRAELQRLAGGNWEVLRLSTETAAANLAPPTSPATTSEAHRSNGSPDTLTIASLPTSLVMTRYWHLPDTDDQRVRQMVAHRLEAELPVSMDELTWGFRRDSTSPLTENGRAVLAQAARADRIRNHMATLTKAGLTIDTLTTEAEGYGEFCRYGLSGLRRDQLEVILFGSTDEWILVVCDAGLPRIIRHLRPDATDPDTIARQCRQVLMGESAELKPTRLLWCGRDDLSETAALIGEHVGLPMETATPVPALQTTGPELAAYAPAIGLALAGLNEPDRLIRLSGAEAAPIRRQHELIERVLARPKQCIAAGVATLVLATVIYLLALSSETKRMRNLVQAAERDNTVLAGLQPKLEVMNRLAKYRIDVESIIAAATAKLPNSIVLSGIHVSREHGLTLKGKAGNPKEVFAYVDTLRQSGWFTNVVPEGPDTSQNNMFTIKADIEVVTSLTPAGAGGGLWR